MVRVAASLYDQHDASHRQARASGFSPRSIDWALSTVAAPWATRAMDEATGQVAAIREAGNNTVAAGVTPLAFGAVNKAEAPVSPYALDSEIRDLARRRAELMAEEIGAQASQITPESLLLRLDLRAQELDARPLAGLLARLADLPLGEQLQQVLGRLQCRIWWRRQLRRAVVVKRETMANQTGEVSRARRKVYVTDETVSRKAERNASNAAMLERTSIEDEAGQVITLAQAVAASTANKAIRRGELMTRIRGAEEWATAAGMVGLFTTNTPPSRFHAVHHTGKRNHKHSGDERAPGAGDFGPVQPNTPRDAQEWLCKTWARCRAALQRFRGRRLRCMACGTARRGQSLFGSDLFTSGLPVFGFRVAEPHHDGCPHWHMLLWTKPEHLAELRQVMRAYWLAESGTEQGAQQYRFMAEPIRADKGGAVAYVAKYISKNIDDVGAIEAEGHTDAHAGEQGELFGATARRVEAWASAWGIRQFQAIGQPPVTVWRELRRVSAQTAEGGTLAVQAAHAAVNRTDAGRANWGAYLKAQGGAMVGRGYKVRIVADEDQRAGRYGTSAVLRPMGVCDTTRPDDLIASDRRTWKPRGTWTQAERVPHVALWRLCVPWERQEGARVNSRANGKGAAGAREGAARAAVHTWTRVNNCTPQDFATEGAQDLLALLRANFGTLGSEKPEQSNHGRTEPSHRDHRDHRSASRAG